MPTEESRPLAGVRIVEVSSFVASPLCGLTLSQLGAEVIRVDPIGGAADVNRWPLTDDGTTSIYWTGLNKGKKSVTADLRSPEGQRMVQRLVTESGPGGGILVTNSGGREWMSHNTLARLRPDVIVLELLGGSDGSPAVDYTVNAGLGFPQITGPVDHDGPVNHVLPAWDVVCGLYAALAVTSAVRRREQTGQGASIRLPLEDTALSIASTLGYLTEPQVNAHSRPATGNDVYGTYGTDVVTADGDRYIHRSVLNALFGKWFAEHSTDEAATALDESSVLAQRYRSFDEVVESGALTDNPLFAELTQTGIGTYLAAGHPASFDGEHYFTGPAARLGADTPEG